MLETFILSLNALNIPPISSTNVLKLTNTFKVEEKLGLCGIFLFWHAFSAENVLDSCFVRRSILWILSTTNKPERPKLAPYLRLKNASECQRIGQLGTLSWKNESLTMPEKLKGGTLEIFQHPFCRKISKNWRGPFGEEFSLKKSLTEPKKSLTHSKGVPFGPVEFLRWCKNTTSQGK